MISYNDLSKLLLGLGGKKAAEVPDELRVIVQAYWESEILAQSTNGSGLQSDLSRPSEFQELIQYFQEYSIQDLNIERDYPNIAVTITLIAIWLGQIRDPLLQQCTEAPITENHLRTWTECLLLVIRYLESTLNPGDSKQFKRPRNLSFLRDTDWVGKWVGQQHLAQQIVNYVSGAELDSRGNYEAYREAGVRHFLRGINRLIEEPTPIPDWTKTPPLTGALFRAQEVGQSTQSVTGTAVEKRLILSPGPLFLPPLPRLRVERQQQAGIIAALLSGQHRVLILYGGAGMGKTTLIGQVLRTPEVRAAFLGGIAWADGNGLVEETASAWCAALGLKGSSATTWARCWRRKGASAGKILLVLDDVVKLSNLAALSDGFGPEATLLLTTQFGQETWEELAHAWVAPEAIQRLHIGPFTPVETRHLVEQAQHRPLTDEEWGAIEQIGIQTGWEPAFLARVALQNELEAWQKLLAELKASGLANERVQDRVKHQWQRLEGQKERSWLEQLPAYMLKAAPFGVTYATQIWNVHSDVALSRLDQLSALGLVEELEYADHDPLGFLDRLWQIRPNVLTLFWAMPGSGAKDKTSLKDFHQQRGRWSRNLARKMSEQGIAIPWQFRLCSIPWWIFVIPWEALGWGAIKISNWIHRSNENWKRQWLPGAEDARLQELQRHGLSLPLEYQCLFDATMAPDRQVIRWGILIVFAVLFLPFMPWFTRAQRVELYASFFYQNLFRIVPTILGLWFLAQLAWIPWLFYRMGVDYLPLRWLARVARWLGMREPERGDGER